MYKKTSFVISIFLFLIFFSLKAQTIKWGKGYPLTAKSAFVTTYDYVKDKYTMLDNGEGIYTCKREKDGKITIDKFSYNLDRIFTKTISVPVNGGKPSELVKFFLSDGKIRLAVADFGDMTAKVSFYDVLPSGTISAPISAVENNDISIMLNDQPESSSETKNVLLFSYNPYDSKDPGVSASYAVLSPDLKTVIKKGKFRLPLNFKLNDQNRVYFEFTELKLAADNSIHGICKVPKDNEQKEKLKEYFKYEVFSFYPDNNEVKLYSFLKPDQYISGAKLFLPNPGTLEMSILYTGVGSIYFDGISDIKIDLKSRSLLSRTDNPSPRQVIEPLVNGKKLFRNSFAYKWYSKKADGGTILLLENYYVSGGYYYNNFLLRMELDKNGKVIKTTGLPKYQGYTSPDYYFSVVPFQIGEKLNVVYLELAENISVTTPADFKMLQLVTAAGTISGSFDNQGNIERKILYTRDKEQTLIKPEYYLPLKDGIVIYGEQGATFSLGMIKF